MAGIASPTIKSRLRGGWASLIRYLRSMSNHIRTWLRSNSVISISSASFVVMILGTLSLVFIGLALIYQLSDFYNVGIELFLGLMIVSLAWRIVWLPSNPIISRLRVGRHRLWLWQQSLFASFSSLDFMISVLIFGVFLRTHTNLSDQIAVATGLSVFAATTFLYRFFILNVFGQECETVGWTSLIGAASYARLAHLLFRNHRREGMRYLNLSLSMMNDAMAERRLRAINIGRVMATLQPLEESGQALPFGPLGILSETLSSLPRLDQIPWAFRRFVHHVKWSKSFKVLPASRFRLRLDTAAAVLAALGAILAALLPETIKQTILSALLSAVVVEALIGIPSAFIAYRYWIRLMNSAPNPLILWQLRGQID